MQKNNFSDELTKLATVEQAKARYKLSRNLLMKYAKESDALIRLGSDCRVVRIDITKFDKWLEKTSI